MQTLLTRGVSLNAVPRDSAKNQSLDSGLLSSGKGQWLEPHRDSLEVLKLRASLDLLKLRIEVT